MKIENASPFFVLLIFILFIGFGKDCGAGVRNEKRDHLSTPVGNVDEKRLVFEKKLLEGLMKLLDLKQHEIVPDKQKTAERIIKNENLFVKREVNDRGIVLYTVNAQFVPINDILEAIASYSGRKIFIDEDIGEKTMTTVVSVSLENTPFSDIMEIIIGSSGLESIVSDDIVIVTLPAKLDVVSAYDYYKEKAVQVYQMAMIKYPDYENIADAYFELGDFYLAAGLPTIALQEFQIILEKYKGYPKGNISMYNIAKCYELLGDTENALKSYLMYAKKYPRDANVGDAYLKAGDLWRKQNEYQKAIEIFKYIISEFQGKDIARVAELRLGYTYIDNEDYVSALKLFTEMKERELFRDFHNEIEYQMGNCCYLMGEYSKAIDILNKFIMYNEGNELLVDAYYKLADCFFKLEEYLAAFQLYKGALSEFNESSLAPYGYLHCGISLRKLKMFENAAKILREGFRLYPDNVYTGSMKFEMALCYYEDGNFKRAFDVFESITQDTSNSSFAVEANMYAGICLSGEKQYQRALEFYQKALDAAPAMEEREWIFSLIGDCYTELGELANAVKAYQQEFPR
ncbi:MAG: tetratricopeptide repeat protein [Candidatus Scalindua sp.]|nr:tetratricopeptide repeat protein [Candidatus Scalindua sp.]